MPFEAYTLLFDQDEEARDRLTERLLPYAQIPIPVEEELPALEEVVFEWNRVDTSQFEASPAFEALSGNAALSVVATPYGNALQLAHDQNFGGNVRAVFLTVDPIVFPDDRRHLRFEYELYSLDPSSTSNKYFGPAVMADDSGSGLHALVHLSGSTGGTEWGYRVDEGSFVSASGTGSGPASGLVRVWFRGNRNGGDKPWGSSTMLGAGSSSAEGSVRRTGLTRGDSSVDDWGTSELPASWNSLALDRIGIACNTNLSTTGQYQILSFRVVRENVL